MQKPPGANGRQMRNGPIEMLNSIVTDNPLKRNPADRPAFTVWPAIPAWLAVRLGLACPRSVWANQLPAGVTADELRDWLGKFVWTRGLTSQFTYSPEYDFAELAIITPGLPFDDGRPSHG